MHLSNALCKHAMRQTGAIGRIEESVMLARICFNSSYTNQMDLSKRILNLSNILFVRFHFRGLLDDLAEAIDLGRRAIKLLPIDAPQRTLSLTNLGEMLGQQYLTSGCSDDIQKSIQLCQESVNTVCQNSRDRLHSTGCLGKVFYIRYFVAGHMSDLEQGIRLLSEVVDLTLVDDLERGDSLINLGTMLVARAEHCEGDGLDIAIRLGEQAIKLTPEQHPDHAVYQENLANWLHLRYCKTGDPADLDHAVVCSLISVKATHINHLDRPIRLSTLGNNLCDRFKLRHDPADFQESIRLVREAEHAVQEQHLRKPAILHNLSRVLYEKSLRDLDIHCLEESIMFSRAAFTHLGSTSPMRIVYMSQLGCILGEKFQWGGCEEDILEAINIGREEVKLKGTQQPREASSLNNLGNRLHERYLSTGDVTLLQESVKLGEEALLLVPATHPQRAIILVNLALRLGDQAALSVAVEPLNEAIQKAKEACLQTIPGKSNRMACIKILAPLLRKRYLRLEAFQDLEEAISLGQEALEEAYIPKPSLAEILNDLSYAFRTKFHRLHEISDLEKALQYGKQAITELPESHLLRPMFMMNLSITLGILDKENPKSGVVEHAISLSKQILNNYQIKPSFIGLASNNLSCLYMQKFETSDDEHDLDCAIQYMRSAIHYFPQSNPDHAGMLHNLGQIIKIKYAITKSADDLANAQSAFERAFRHHEGTPRVRSIAALFAGLLYAQVGDWKKASEAFTTGVKQLPYISPKSLPRDDQQHVLRGLTTLSSLAASTSLWAGISCSSCLELLELGRGVMSTISVGQRNDISDLQAYRPDMWAKYEEARDTLSNPYLLSSGSAIMGQELSSDHLILIANSYTNPILSEFVERNHHAAQQMEEIETEVRGMEGFEQFQRPPSSKDLIQLADNGPIVSFNVTQFRADAFIITTSGIDVLHLPNLDYSLLSRYVQDIIGESRLSLGLPSTKASRNASMRTILGWLWDVAVCPVLEKLGLLLNPIPEELPRLFWCTSGPMGILPIHAAGYYELESTCNAPSHVVSTYTPTLLLLKHARQKSSPFYNLNRQILMLSTPEENGPGSLRLGDELAVIKLSMAKARIPAPRVIEHPCVKTALNEMKLFGIIHFACHGQANPTDPSSSSLLIGRPSNPENLTVRNIISNENKNAHLAYLSSCSTAANMARDLMDEVIHLSSAFQLAGFPHVIGSLWEVPDKAAIDIAGQFYEHLARRFQAPGDGHGAVARALHEAVRIFREGGDNAGATRRRRRVMREDVLSWSTLIHSGA